MLALLGTQAMAEDKFKVEAYDCSQPMNIKMFDHEAHCRFDPGDYSDYCTILCGNGSY